MLNQLSRPVGIHLFICFVAGRCVCTPGLSYITINNYQPRNDRNRDDVRFEFKSTQSSGMIMFLKGRYRDSLYVAYEDSRVFIVHIDLGTGNTACRTKGLPGVLGNKGTLAKYRREQGNMNPFLGSRGTELHKLEDENNVSKFIKRRPNTEKVWEHGNIGQFWKGTREQGPPWETLRT